MTRRPDVGAAPVGPAMTSGGRVHTHFGTHASAREVADDLAGAGRPAVSCAQRAWQVVLVDPVPGRNTLRAWLAAHLSAPTHPARTVQR
jgi:hypothetical protein